jgi:mono/diheme cytochrome c family protein
MRVQHVSACLLALCASVLVAGLKAQQPVKSGATEAQLERGKTLFVQRCSVCHLPPLGPGEPRSYARSLTGFVKSSESEAASRVIIQRGVQPRMPGFRYGLEPNEIDDIVTYLSTLK